VICHHCGRGMIQLGCRSTDMPFYWCAGCGSTRTCDGNQATPADAHRLAKADARGRLVSAVAIGGASYAAGIDVDAEFTMGQFLACPIPANLLQEGTRMWEMLLKDGRNPPVETEEPN